jgi:hypothetical protein
MLSLGPDPGADIAIVRAPGISTLRTFAMIDSSERVFTQDSRDNSLISGFSEIGGLWTFLSGIFAVMFGSSLMRVLFGGFAHPSHADNLLRYGFDADPLLFKVLNQYQSLDWRNFSSET